MAAATTVLATASPATPAAADPVPSRPGSAPAATLFSTSFEPADPPPTWVSTVDTDATGAGRSSGVDGPASIGMPGSVAGLVDEVTASGEFTDAGEVKENLVDGDINSKWLTFTATSWLGLRLTTPAVVVRYALTSANDAATRDPQDWTLRGSTDGTDWTTLDTRTGQTFADRFSTREYGFTNTTGYRYYRLDITRNAGSSATQLAEVQLATADTSTPPPGDMAAAVGKGPASSPTAKSRAGFTGLRALRVAGRHRAEGRAYAFDKAYEVDIPVGPSTELSYLIFPELTDNDLRYPSTYMAVDLAFSDGGYLSDLGAVDQHGAVLSPRGQGESKTLYTAQWNAKRSTIGAVAAGRTISRILVGYDGPSGPVAFGSWVDDIVIANPASAPPSASPADHVLTTRGTQSTGSFSRGNNVPATAVPHGFNFWTPVTNAGSTGWLYEYHRANNAENLPTLQALSLSHETSPWMGDRQTFQVMPSTAAGVPDPGRAVRALPFRHSDEIAKPHYYGVTFTNGLHTEIAPTDHAALFRFTFPEPAGAGDAGSGDAGARTGTLIFDNVDDRAALTIDPYGAVTGYSDVRSGLSTGATRMFIYATVNRPVVASGSLATGNRPGTGFARYDLGADRTLQMRVATSLISLEQAKHNLELEIEPADTLESVRARAQRLWDDELGVIQVEGASRDQLTTLYSNLYRLMLYPNSGHENVGTAAAPVYRHAVQSSTTTPASTPTQTGTRVVDGKVYVNNGFWDTYRTTWPAYTLLAPEKTGEMIDGFVQQYKDGGWISRWSSPGYANLMVGTSSDVAFADAYLKGVRNFDVDAAYAAAIRNATVLPPNDNVGRKGMNRSPFLGYTPKGSTGEALSWALDGYINDFGIANLAAARAAEATDPQVKRRYEEEAGYFGDRARQYVNMFDPAVGFFQGRNADGSWAQRPEDFEPRSWGGEYTETNAWNMAFHVPQDGRGLANLYGGTAGLADKLDTFFATPETATFPGGYGGTIHEMIEARDVRMGQYGHSNQPSHHIIYMYDYAGQPWKTQVLVREALSRLYLGSEIGQGYPGDEDNGEMSAWQIFGALGFYPLQMGSPNYVVGSPLFTKATVNLAGGKKLVVNAPENNARNVYIQGLKVNGKAYGKTYLPHDLLAAGATLDFTMGATPSTWGTGPDAAPISITKGGAVPTPSRDLTGTAQVTSGTGADVSALVDDTATTRATLAGTDPLIQVAFTGPGRRATSYTLTSPAGTGAAPAAGDPTDWLVEGSYDGKTWAEVDRRTGEQFASMGQTRPFTIGKPGRYARYRLTITRTAGSAAPALAEIQLLGQPDPACTRTISDRHAGALDVTGVTCLTAGAAVTGSVNVRPGASLIAVDASIGGALAAAGAANVILLGSAVAGSVAISGTTGELSVEHSTIGGAAAIDVNRTGSTPPLIAGSTVGGPLSCQANTPPPVNNGLPNTAPGGRAGQCREL